MKTLIVLIVVVGAGLAVLIARLAQAQDQKHDPIEYYRGWYGYRHPIYLKNKITKEEADVVAAKGSAYLIGYFDADGKLTRVVKMLRGSMFFEFVYAYHPGGRLNRVKVTNADGVVSVREYDESDRPTFFWK